MNSVLYTPTPYQAKQYRYNGKDDQKVNKTTQAKYKKTEYPADQ